MRPVVFIVAENHAVARACAYDHRLRFPEWQAVLDWDDARRLRGLEAPTAQSSASKFRVLIAGRIPRRRGYGDIIQELQAMGFVDANGDPPRSASTSTDGGTAGETRAKEGT